MALGHGSKVVTDGLVLALDAANPRSYPGTGTTWYDLSGNENHGTLTNGPNFDAENNGSIVFDGSNDRVQISSSSAVVALLPSFSVDIYFNRNALFDKYLYSETDENDGNPFWGITSNQSSLNAEYLRIYARNNSGTLEQNFQPTVSGYSIYGNGWHNLVAVYESNLITFYVDGVSVGSNAWVKGSYSSLNRVNIGGWQFSASSGGHMNGKIASIKTYDKALTSQEIQQNFNALRGRYGL